MNPPDPHSTDLYCYNLNIYIYIFLILYVCMYILVKHTKRYNYTYVYKYFDCRNKCLPCNYACKCLKDDDALRTESLGFLP